LDVVTKTLGHDVEVCSHSRFRLLDLCAHSRFRLLDGAGDVRAQPLFDTVDVRTQPLFDTVDVRAQPLFDTVDVRTHPPFRRPEIRFGCERRQDLLDPVDATFEALGAALYPFNPIRLHSRAILPITAAVAESRPWQLPS